MSVGPSVSEYRARIVPAGQVGCAYRQRAWWYIDRARRYTSWRRSGVVRVGLGGSWGGGAEETHVSLRTSAENRDDLGRREGNIYVTFHSSLVLSQQAHA